MKQGRTGVVKAVLRLQGPSILPRALDGAGSVGRRAFELGPPEERLPDENTWISSRVTEIDIEIEIEISRGGALVCHSQSFSFLSVTDRGSSAPP